MSSVNSADKEKVFAVYLVVFLLSAFWSGSFSKLSCKKKLEWKINFFFYWLFEVAVSRNSPAKKKAGVKNQLFLLLAFWSGSFSKLSCKEKSWSGKPTFSFTGFWKWQFLETDLHIKWLTCPRQAAHLTCGLPRAYRFYVFYRIYPIWGEPVRPVHKRLSGKTQSGKFSKVITILRVAQNCECWKAVESIHIA